MKNSPPAVNDVSFEINNGEVVGFAGLNGAGKTTAIRMIAGIIMPTAGTILVDGKDVQKEKIAASENLGLVPELPNFDLSQKPIPLLRYYAGFYGIDRRSADQKIEELMKKFSIWEYRERKLRAYSQGMKKRFSIVSAMLADPSNVLFDETLNGLDPEGVKNMRTFMTDLKKQGKAVFLSSHILSELQHVADRIVIIKRGSIVKILETSDIPKLGTQTIRLSVTNPDDKMYQILSQYGEYQTQGAEITIKKLQVSEEQAVKLNGELARAGYDVSMFDVTGSGLEDYFLELVGGH